MSYKQGIVVAILDLKDRNGSSLISIKKHMQENLPKDKKWLNAHFLNALKTGVTAGDLVQIKNSYKLSADFKKSTAKKLTDSTNTKTTKTATAKKSTTKKVAPKTKVCCRVSPSGAGSALLCLTRCSPLYHSISAENNKDYRFEEEGALLVHSKVIAVVPWRIVLANTHLQFTQTTATKKSTTTKKKPVKKTTTTKKKTVKKTTKTATKKKAAPKKKVTKKAKE